MPTTRSDRMPNDGAGTSRDYQSDCARCLDKVTIHLDPPATAHGQNGSRGTVTYADADLAVWVCPGCGSTNADAFNE